MIIKFVREWFPFNRQERKGILPLLILIALIQVSVWLHAAFYTPVFPRIEEIPMELLTKEEGEREGLRKPQLSEGIEGEREREGEREGLREPKLREGIEGGRGDRELRKNWKLGESNKWDRTRLIKTDTFSKKKQEKHWVDINQADSLELVALPGIGPVLASKILDLRNRLGGYHSLEQLTSIRGFREDLLFDLQGRIRLVPGSHKKIEINTVSLEELRQHPCFKFTLSRALINYRQQHGPFLELNDLRKIVLVNDSIFSLILPYVRIGER